MFANEYTPTNAMAEVLAEEEAVDDGQASPVVVGSGSGSGSLGGMRSLQEELEGGDSDNDDNHHEIDRHEGEEESDDESGRGSERNTQLLFQEQPPQLDIAGALAAAAAPATAPTLETPIEEPETQTNSDTEEEPVDWDGLEKREDEQLREQEADNVGDQILVLGSTKLTTIAGAGAVRGGSAAPPHTCTTRFPCRLLRRPPADSNR
jgi:hypothetical protein